MLEQAAFPVKLWAVATCNGQRLELEGDADLLIGFLRLLVLDARRQGVLGDWPAQSEGGKEDEGSMTDRQSFTSKLRR